MMIRKRIEQAARDYFTFTSGERRGVIFLLILLVLIIAFPFAYQWTFPPVLPDIVVTEIQSVNEASMFTASATEAPETFPFDPNTVSGDEMRRLGFSASNIRTISRYREKGGRFRKASDLARIYGISPELSARLTPYVNIAPKPGHASLPSDSVPRKRTAAVVELNRADSQTIVSLYRIGPALTHRIIEYRQKLGGFVSLNQLKEIWGFDEDILYDLQGKISVDASLAKIHNVNTVTVEDLSRHPYFKYKLSGQIVNYRTQHGPYKDLSDLRKIVTVNDSVYNRIVLYLKTD